MGSRKWNKDWLQSKSYLSWEILVGEVELSSLEIIIQMHQTTDN